MLLQNLALYALAFFLIWFGAGLIISSVSKFSRKLRLAPFAFSFVFLGVLTSIPEFSVGLQAVANQDGEIFVGNLLGGIVVLFLVVIPLLAVLGNGINIKREMNPTTLLAALGVILTPSLLALDRQITNTEGIVLIALYGGLLFLVERNHGIFDKKNSKLLKAKTYSYLDLLKLLLGIGIVFAASHLIVDKTIYLAQLFEIPVFYVSLIVVALGTDLPELTLAVRSVVAGQKEIALGDYLGAAAVTPFLFGLFTLLHNGYGESLEIKNFAITFIFTLIALVLFWFFSASKNKLSRNEGLIMLGTYALFVVVELVRR